VIEKISCLNNTFSKSPLILEQIMKWHFFWQFDRRRTPVLTVVLPVCLGAIAIGCTVAPGKAPQSDAAPAVVSAATQPLQVAVIPWQSQEQQQAKLQPLADYLQKVLNRPVGFQITKDYASAVEAIVNGEVDMAYLAAVTYIKARERKASIQPIVLPIDETTGRPWYTSVIVANADKGINSLQDLKGKRFAFVSPSSTSGFLLPLDALLKQGIDPTRDFPGIRYSGSHDKVGEDLVKGVVDAAADDKATFLRSLKEGKIPAHYKIIWESDPLPAPPIVINTEKFSPETIAQLQQAFIDAPMGVVDVTGTKSAGYTLGKDSDFEAVRQIYLRLKSVTVAAK
jgi:phosphonate transport system substrate-binding protein